MKPPGKRAFWIVCRAALLVAFLLFAPISLVWFGARQAEKDIAAGNLEHFK